MPRPSPSVCPRRLPLWAACALLGASLACRGTRGAGPWSPWGGIDADVRPALEEVFLEPPLYGVPPEAAGLSADGNWLLVRWSDPGVPDARATEPEEPAGATLRLLQVGDPKKSDQRGVPLESLLPPVGGRGDDAEPEAFAWSRRGALLAVARGPDVLLLDPARGRAVPVLVRPAQAPTEGEPGEGETEEDDQEAARDAEEGEEEEPFPDEHRVRRLAFAPDDAGLRIFDGDDLFVIALPPGGLPDEPPPFEPTPAEAVRSVGANLGPAPRRLSWSRALDVVFGHDPTPLEEPDEEGEAEVETELDESDDEEPAQVFLLSEQRAVVLAGMHGMEWIERTSLSPDGRWVMGVEFDRSAEPDPTLVPDYLTERVSTTEGRRQLADGTPSPFRMWLWRTDSGERTAVLPELLVIPEEADVEAPETPDTISATGDPGEDAASEAPGFWLRTLGWAPQETAGAPARFAFELYSEDFREVELWCWTEGEVRQVWHERDEAWIGGPVRSPRWNADGTRLVLGSESTTRSFSPGRAQLFSVDPEDGEAVQLTELEGEVASFRMLPGGGLVYEGSREDPARRVLGRLGRDAVLGRVRRERDLLVAPEGWNTIVGASRDGARVVFRHEELMVPGELWVTDGASAFPLTDTTPEAYEERDWIRPRRLSLATADDRTVHAHVYLPPGTTLEGGGGPRATIVFVHGAGYLQNVTDSMTSYPLNAMFHSRLARLGYPVVDVDYRGSRGYGRDFRTDVKYHLGGKDLDDIHLVVDELAERGLVDPARVGIYGGSYGGFMAMMALFTAPDRWACGAALRSVTDWRTYHPWYTQPRLGRPSTHPEAFERSSPIDHVDGLEDPLLVLHGMRDSNVFAQDSIRLIEALIDRGADFEAMLYPSQGHAFADGPHWLDEYRRIERFLLRHLGEPEASGRPPARSAIR